MNPQPWTDRQKEMYIVDALIERGELLDYCFLDAETGRRFIEIIKHHKARLDAPASLQTLMMRLDPDGLAAELGGKYTARYVQDMLRSTMRRLEYWQAKSNQKYRQPSLWDAQQ